MTTLKRGICCALLAALAFAGWKWRDSSNPTTSKALKEDGSSPCVACSACGQNHAGDGRSASKQSPFSHPVRRIDSDPAGQARPVRESKPGSELNLDFGADLNLKVKVGVKKDFPGQRQSTSMQLVGREGEVYWLEDAEGNVMGNVILKEDGKNLVYRFKGQEGNWSIQQIAFQEYVCASGDTDQSVGMPASDDTFTPAGQAAIIPLLNSLPGADAVVYIDFDGEVVSGTRWVSGGTINAEPAGYTESEIRQVWEEVAEDMRPFQINVTTDRAVFDAASQNKKMMCIVTPTNDAAPGAGGVAYLNSFYDGSVDPCWCFNLGLSAAAMTVSHEIGHTFGLRHDGLGGQEYHPGNGTWGPIMGAPFGNDVVTWSIGDYQDKTNTEDDLAIIDSRSANYRADDYGNSAGDAFDLAGNVGQESVNVRGIIERTNDVDVFKFKTSGGDVSLGASPTSAYTNMNLSVQLYDSSGTLVAENDPAGSYSANITTSLPPGNYTFHVSGTGDGSPEVSGFTDYGSLGQFGLTGNVEGLGGLIVDITEPQLENVSIAEGNGIILAASVIGEDDSVSWVAIGAPFGGAVSFSAPYEKATRATFSQPGLYTLRFRASKGETFTDKTIQVSVEEIGGQQFFSNRGPVITVNSPDEFYSREGLLSGRALDDGVPSAGQPALDWVVVSGTAQIQSPSASSPTILFQDSEPNLLSLESSDGQIRTFKEMVVRSAYQPREVVAAATPGRWMIPTNDALGLTWTASGFDDASWTEGGSGFGYDNGSDDYVQFLVDGTNLQPAMKGTSSSAFIRIPFTLPPMDYVQDLKLKINYNDAFVMYLNGEEVARRNTSAGPILWNTVAHTSRNLGDVVVADEIDLTAALESLSTGENVLAIHGLNDSKNDNRFLIYPVLTAGVIDTPYLAFMEQYGTGLLPGGDEDEDGLLNFIEHALGTNPLVDDAVTPLVAQEDGSVQITLPQTPPADVDYILEKSLDMINWEAIATKRGTSDWTGDSILLSVADISEGNITYEIRQVTALSSSFYRLGYSLRGPVTGP